MPWFDCATRKPITVNHGGTLAPNLGLVLHHAVMNGSLHGFFSNPNSRVSTHFWVAKDGRLEQYVDTALRCWGGMNLNQSYVQIETEGCATPPHAEPMTEAMVNALARLYAEGMARHGWQPRHANANGQPGLGYHRMAGSGANTACICDVRLAMRDSILAKATAGAYAPPSSSPPPQEVDDNMMIRDDVSGGYWVADRLGAVHSYEGAPFLGGVNNAKANAAGYPCVGLAPWKDGYCLALDWGDAGAANGQDRFRRYHFPRDGSGIIR
jgi:hypothetical protein